MKIYRNRISKEVTVIFGSGTAFYILSGKRGYGLAVMLKGHYFELALKYKNYNREDWNE